MPDQYVQHRTFLSTGTGTAHPSYAFPPWHTDLSWLSEPPSLAVLNARWIPDRGGDTIWVDLFAAYDALPEETQRRAQHLRLRHRPQPHFFETVRRHHGDEIKDRLIAQNAPVDHPLVRSHPSSGRPALLGGAERRAYETWSGETGVETAQVAEFVRPTAGFSTESYRRVLVEVIGLLPPRDATR